MNIKVDSRKVTKGDTFVALPGIKTDGHDYIEKAIENGATEIIAQHGKYLVDTLLVEDARKYLSDYLKETFSDDLKDIKFIGVTGTNGKTTICYLIYNLLNILGLKAAYIGTIGFYIDNQVESLDNTTPEITDLYDMFLKAKEKGVKVIVMEVSSHALEQGRVDGIEFDYAAFTNLTKEHLDFHINMENYSKAKQKLFERLKDEKVAVINADDDYYKDFIKDQNNNLTLGFNKDSDYKILDYELHIDKTDFKFEYQNNTYSTTINLPGEYNIHNFLTALIIVNKMGYSIEEILSKTNILSAPPGRMDTVSYKGRSIIIDYAHTPDAVENVLNCVNSYKKAKVITLVGCGGDRDRAKRPVMGDIATRLSDYVIFSNDNPRTEDEKQIMDDITRNLKANNYEIEYDREKAIKKGMSLLQEKDMFLILGKGHETYQIIGKEHIHFSDKEEVEKYIKEHN
ncbi:MAG TPA: UDP-N-acetylmuramoyl-L-alanyl-D-glutamate--2,6-diaminopimelate ligase [Bacilli bacterium]|nr:UDP-N-acetylmuramoyl-L-alanyl-D-glutamate--2,6-diaminopimelate ligase [Bacilli bacterium]